jgi:hypothetical protein
MASQNFTFVKVNSQSKNYSLIFDFYHNVCKFNFNEHELEDFNKWVKALDNNKNIYTFFIIIVLNNCVVGGISCEIYNKCKCALISYIAINSNYRGYGLSKKLISESIKEINTSYSDITDIFAEIKIVENDKDIERQNIWDRLNFVPFNLLFIHPGYLKWKYYQLAIYNTYSKENVVITKSKLIDFFEEFFDSILEDHNESEIKKIKDTINLDNNNNDYISAHKTQWKSQLSTST